MGITICTDSEKNTYEVSYEGAVLTTRERNWRDDSDFYALVWDGGRVKEVTYATTRAWTYKNGASVDATPEVQRAARKWIARNAFPHALAALRELRSRGACQINRGDEVFAWKGRKVKPGTVGRVFWTGFGRSYRYHEQPPARIGIELESGEKVFAAASNFVRIGAASPIVPWRDAARKAIRYSHGCGYMPLGTSRGIIVP